MYIRAKVILLFLLFVSFLCVSSLHAGEYKIDRIVSLQPNITEILFSINLDNEIVGVTDFCDWPKQAREKTRVGSYVNPNLESILALKPDVVIGEKNINKKILRHLKHLGIKTHVVSFENLQQLDQTILDLGNLTQRQGEARMLQKQLNLGLQPVHVDHKRSVRALLIIGRKPLFAVGVNNYMHELIERAGAVNVASDAVSQFPQFNVEALITRQPEVIIDLSMGSESSDSNRREAMEFWKGFSSIPAVQQGRVYFLNSDLILRPGPRLVDGYKQLQKAFYPEKKIM